MKSPTNSSFKSGSLLTYALWPTGKLSADPRNARQHSEEQIEAISRSIKKFGMTTPILATAKGMIVAGEGRWRAALLLKLKEVPVLTAPKSWTAADVKAYAIADNQLSDSSEWNDEVLRDELRALAAEGFDVSVVGFTQEEIAKMLEERGVTGPDSFPSFNETIETHHECPNCHYKWSGNAGIEQRPADAAEA